MAQDIQFWLQIDGPTMARDGEYVPVLDYAGRPLTLDGIGSEKREFLPGDMVVYLHPGDAEGKTRVGKVLTRIHGILTAAKDTDDTMDIILMPQSSYSRLR